MRIVRNARDESMPTCWPPNDQGRDLPYDESGSPVGGAMFGLLVAIAILASAIGIGLIIYGSVS